MHLQGEEKWYKHLAAKEIKQKQKHMMAIFVFTYFILSLLPFLQKFFRWRQTNNSVAKSTYKIDYTQRLSKPQVQVHFLNICFIKFLSARGEPECF